MDEMWPDFEMRGKKNEEVEEREGRAREKDDEIQTIVRGERKRKMVPNCKSSLTALTDRPIIA